MGTDGWVDMEVNGVEEFADVADGAAVVKLALVRFVAGLFDVPAAPTGAAVFTFFFMGSLISFLSCR
jgi:hypothetical protein